MVNFLALKIIVSLMYYYFMSQISLRMQKMNVVTKKIHHLFKLI